MDSSIQAGVSSTEERLPGRLGVRRRAPGLYRRLFKGFYPSQLATPRPSPSLHSPNQAQLSLSDGFNAPPPTEAYSLTGSKRGREPRAPLVVGDFEHDLQPVPWKQATFPGLDFLSCYAIAGTLRLKGAPVRLLTGSNRQ